MKKQTRVKKPVLKGAAKVPGCHADGGAGMRRRQPCDGACLLRQVDPAGAGAVWTAAFRGTARTHATYLRAARSYGLTAKGYRYEPEELKANGKFPCIIHWNFNHFVVLNGFQGNKAVLNDPAKGTYSVPDEDLRRILHRHMPVVRAGRGASCPSGKPQSACCDLRKSGWSARARPLRLSLLTTVISSLLGIMHAGVFAYIFSTGC